MPQWTKDRYLRAVHESSLGLHDVAVALAYAMAVTRDGDTAAMSWDMLCTRSRLSKGAAVAARKRVISLGWLEVVEPGEKHKSATLRITIPVGHHTTNQGGSDGHHTTNGWSPGDHVVGHHTTGSTSAKSQEASSSGDDVISDQAFAERLQVQYDVGWPGREISDVSARLRNALGGDRARARAFLTYLAENRIIKKSLAGYFAVIHSDDELRTKVSVALDKKKQQLPPIPKCDACNPARRLEDADGSDLGPCPTCHPSIRLMEGAA